MKRKANDALYESLVGTTIFDWTIKEYYLTHEYGGKEAPCFKIKCKCGTERVSPACTVVSKKMVKCCKSCTQSEIGEQRKKKTEEHILSEVIGKKFHSFTTLEYVGRNSSDEPLIRCKCDCGNIRDISIWALRNDKHRNKCHSCASEDLVKHGYARTTTSSKEYATYYAMLDRCNNPNNREWHNYGGRGIKVDDRWLGPDGFTNFYGDIGPKPIIDGVPSKHIQIDRIDNNSDYCKSNVRWTDNTSNQQNKRKTLFVLYNNEYIQLSRLARKLGVKYNNLYAKYKNKSFYRHEIDESKIAE